MRSKTSHTQKVLLKKLEPDTYPTSLFIEARTQQSLLVSKIAPLKYKL